MARWEVRTRGGTVEVDGGNWLLAVGVALPALGMQPDVLARLVCDVQPDGIVRIVDPVSRTPFLVRRLKDELRADGSRAVSPIGVVAAGGPVHTEAPAPAPAPPAAPPPAAAAPAPAPAPSIEEPEEIDDVDVLLDVEDEGDDEVDVTAPPPSLAMPAPSSSSYAEDTRTFDPELLEPAAPILPAPAPLPPGPPPAPPSVMPQTRFTPRMPEPEPSFFTDEHLRTLDDIEPLLAGSDPETITAPPDDLEEILFMRGMDVADARSRPAAAEIALKILEELIPAEASSVLYAGINDTSLSFVAAHGPTADRLEGIEVPLGSGIAGFCFDNGSALIVRNAAADPRHLHTVDEATGYATQELLSVAVRDSAGRIYGCIQLLNPRTGRFDPWHLEAASTVASTLGDFFLSQS